MKGNRQGFLSRSITRRSDGGEASAGVRSTQCAIHTENGVFSTASLARTASAVRAFVTLECGIFPAGCTVSCNKSPYIL